VQMNVLNHLLLFYVTEIPDTYFDRGSNCVEFP